MSQIVLLRADQNPKGRMLVQEGTSMHVLTGCCQEHFDGTVTHTGTWTRCTRCHTLLDLNPEGWSSDVVNLDSWAEYVPSGISGWAKFWFGLDDFEIEVTLR